MRSRKDSFLSLTGNTLKIAGPAGGIIGTLADIFSPLAPFAPIILVLSLLVFIYFYFFKVRPELKKREAFEVYSEKNAQIAGFTLITAIIMALFWVISSQYPDEGVFAGNIDGIKIFQQRLLGTLDDISDKTDEISLQVENVDIKLDQGFDKLEDLIKEMGINPIDNPKTPQDFLLNAKLEAATGNFKKAKESYKEYFKFGLEYIDPHIEYQNILKNSEGLIVAQNEYKVLNNGTDPFYIYLSAILEDDIETEKTILENIIKKYPQFAPAVIELFKITIIDDQSNWMTMGMNGTDHELSERYQKLDKMKNEALNSGNYLKYFIDKEKAMNLLSDIQLSFFETWRDYNNR